MAELLDRQLLEILRDGQKVLDANGEVVVVSPSAAMLGQVLKRLGQLGIASGPPKTLLDRAFERGVGAGFEPEYEGRLGIRPPVIGPLPPIDTDTDDEATAERRGR